jgi:hypothetical protein
MNLGDSNLAVKLKRGDNHPKTNKKFWHYHRKKEVWVSRREFNKRSKARKEINQRWLANNLDKHNQATKKWRINNPTYFEKYSKICGDRIRFIRRNNYKRRYEEDILYRLRICLSARIRLGIKKAGFIKKNESETILGCTIEEVRKHIESKFTEGMSWSNHGRWEIDHIYPISLATSETELIELFHYTNLQPLWKKDNRRKSNRVDFIV